MRMTLKRANAVIKAAKLNGFGGNCGRAAIAINHVLFHGQGKYVVATNPPLNRRLGRWFMGHVVVEWGGRLFDSTGLVEDEVGLEAWGMLDYADPAVQQLVSEGEAEEGEPHTIDELGDQRQQEKLIEAAMTGLQARQPLVLMRRQLEAALART